MSDLTWFKPEQNRQPEFGPIPPGKYAAVIADSEMKPTKDGTGSYLQLRLVITDGDHRNRQIFTRLNLNNKNETAQKIARGQLAAICDAVGVPQPQDSSQLHDIPLEITITERKGSDGTLQSDVRSYGKLSGNHTSNGHTSDDEVPF